MRRAFAGAENLPARGGSQIADRVTRPLMTPLASAAVPDPGVPRPKHMWLSRPRSSGTMPGTTYSTVR